MPTASAAASASTGSPDLHQRRLPLCHGFLMTAPLLRLEGGFLPTLSGPPGRPEVPGPPGR